MSRRIKLFEEFNLKNIFKSKKQKQAEEMFGTKDLSLPEPVQEPQDEPLNIMIDSEYYELSQFGQEKYGVYVVDGDKTFYIGDIRKYSTGGYASYLRIENYIEKTPYSTLVKPDEEQGQIIDEELNKNYLSRNLMDDTISYIEYIKQNILNEKI